MEKGQNMFSHILTTFKVMFRYTRKASLLKLLEVIITATMTPLSLLFTQKLIDGFAEYFNGSKRISEVVVWIMLLILSMFLISSTTFINGIQSINMKRQLDKEFTQQIINKYSRINYACFEDKKVQDTLNRIGNSPHDLILHTFMDITAALSALITIVGVVLIFVQLAWWLPIVFMAVISVMIWMDFKAMKIMNDMFTNQTVDERLLSYYAGLLSNKNSLFELKVFSATDYIKKLWYDKNDVVLRTRLKTTIRAQKFFAVSSFLVLLWVGMIVFVLISSLSTLSLSLGLFISLAGSALTLLGTTESLSYIFSNITRHYLLVQHYEVFLELPETSGIENVTTYDLSNPSIEFSNVYFSYPNSDNEVLKGISFRIEHGERLAIVGENGAGKSTIIKLLCRLYSPDSGEIKVNDINIDLLSEKQMQHLFSVVFQDYCCYQLTLRENVALSELDRMVDDALVQEALAKGMADEISENLDINLGKIEDDGIDVSGGQWQRIALSRALFSQNPFVILDEPTASLDPLAESEMYRSFGRKLDNKGCIMISHRLASAKLADKIIVIDDGVVCESGEHEELLRLKGVYYEMWIAQSSWYIGVDANEAK